MSNDYSNGKMGGRSPTYVERIIERVRAKNGKKYGLGPDEESEELVEVDVEENPDVDDEEYVEVDEQRATDDYVKTLKDVHDINDSNEEEKRFQEQLKSKGCAYYGYIRRSDIEKMEADAKASSEEKRAKELFVDHIQRYMKVVENDPEKKPFLDHMDYYIKRLTEEPKKDVSSEEKGRFVENLRKCFPEAFDDDRAETVANVDDEFERKILFPTKDELVDNILKFGMLNIIDWYRDAVRRRFSMDDKTFRAIMQDNHLRKAIETIDLRLDEYKRHSEWKVMCNQILHTRIYETVVNPGQNSGDWWYDDVNEMLSDVVDFTLCEPSTAGRYITINGLTAFVLNYINGWNKLFGYDSVKLNHKAPHILDTLERLLFSAARECEFPSAIFQGVMNGTSYVKAYSVRRAEKFDICEVPLLLGSADFHYSPGLVAECASRKDDCEHNEAI